MHSILHMKYLPTFTKDLRNWHRSIFYAWSIWAYHTCTYCIQFIWKLIQLFPNLCQHKSSTNHRHNTQLSPSQRLHRTSTWAPLKSPKSWRPFPGDQRWEIAILDFLKVLGKKISPKWWWKNGDESHGIESVSKITLYKQKYTNKMTDFPGKLC